MRLGSRSQASQSSSKRADDLRRRRTERNEQRVSKASQRAAHPVRVRPVVMRGNDLGMPIHRRAAKTTPRRAFYVTMDRAAGTELRLPSLPMIRPGWRLFSGMIAIAAVVGIYSLWNSFFFRVGGVDVVGLERISAEEINDKLRLEDLSIIEIDPREVTQKVSGAYPELLSVSVAVHLPNYVTLNAVERQPVLAWQQGEQIKWIDEEGVIFPARGEAGPLVTVRSDDALPLVPVLADPAEAEEQQPTGAAEETPAGSQLARQEKIDPVLLNAVEMLSQKLPPETQIAFDGQSGLGWVEPNGTHVYIGTNLSNFEAKYNMYQQIAGQLAAQGQQPYLVSVEHLHAPFYRLEP